jgi:uncharacterized protein (TIGR03067 family)
MDNYMKKYILTGSALFLTLSLFSNDTTLTNRINALEQRLDTANYVRVPRQDFENKLDIQVKNEVYDVVWKWIAGLAIIITGVGFLGSYYLKGQSEKAVKNEFKKGFEEKMNVALKKIESALNMAWNGFADVLTTRAKERKYFGMDLITEIEGFLDNENVKISDEKKITLIDDLMRCYYYTIERPHNRNKKMIDLLRKFEKNFELRPETYSNAAIAFSNEYEFHGNKGDRDTCLENCNNSISRLKDYGIPYTVKLEVFMIDHLKAYSDDDKQTSIENIRRTFKEIENNQSQILPFEIVERIQVDESVPFLEKYIQKLLSMFARELNIIRERALDFLMQDYRATSQTPKYKNILSYILQYGRNSNPIIIEGNWEASFIHEEVISKKIKSNMFFKGQIWAEHTETDRLSGDVYFLTGETPMAMNLYNVNEDSSTDVLKTIYKLEGDTLLICYNPSENRPLEFVSNSENGNTLIRYKRKDTPMPLETTEEHY